MPYPIAMKASSVAIMEMKTREEELEELVQNLHEQYSYDYAWKDICCYTEDEIKEWCGMHDAHLEAYVQARIELDRIQRSK